MKLTKITIKNFRLLVDTELEVDSDTTLIVGRNNTGKTSFFDCIRYVLKQDYHFSFNDYPLSKRTILYSYIDSFMKNKIQFEELRKNVESIFIEFTIDYSLDNVDDDLGALSPFIIDIDVDTTEALIQVEYKLIQDEKKFRNILEEYYNEGDEPFKDAHNAININFNKLFELRIYAVNPKKKDEKQIKTSNELKSLFPIYSIPAERILGEDEDKNNSLSKLISDFFEADEEEFSDDINAKIYELRNVVSSANKTIQEKSDSILSKLIDNTVGFGYPNAEELQLGVTTSLSIDNQIKEQTQLSYKSKLNNESLPECYNGLGYKNLIKIEFLLAAFARNVKKLGTSCIPLLFIEEPESHMHPQMQHTFAEYLEKFLCQINSVKIQTFLTSHSSQIANTMKFSKIRYALKTNNGIIYKNLNKFAKENSDNMDFIMKYLTLTKCDLFFADKAILVEGASERLLLPNMIEKCDKDKMFNNQKYKLSSQYYTIIEIGGAYAFKFIPFVNFLGIPCLIITDLDSVKKNENGKYTAISVINGETTSNETIKWWLKRKKIILNDENEKNTLNQIIQMTKEDKTINKCHIEFQTKENEFCGRSLEESIINVNRYLVNSNNDFIEEKIEFKGKCKTDFALDLIYIYPDYIIPNYIKEGLKWLNDEKVYE